MDDARGAKAANRESRNEPALDYPATVTDNDAMYYEIKTRDWHPNVTKIFKLDKVPSSELRFVA